MPDETIKVQSFGTAACREVFSVVTDARACKLSISLTEYALELPADELLEQIKDALSVARERLLGAAEVLRDSKSFASKQRGFASAASSEDFRHPPVILRGL